MSDVMKCSLAFFAFFLPNKILWMMRKKIFSKIIKKNGEHHKNKHKALKQSSHLLTSRKINCFFQSFFNFVIKRSPKSAMLPLPAYQLVIHIRCTETHYKQPVDEASKDIFFSKIKTAKSLQRRKFRVIKASIVVQIISKHHWNLSNRM